MQKVRIALQNLQGIYDGGFISKGEYTKRKATIIDDATAVSARSAPALHLSKGEVAAAAKASVFDRLGPKQQSIGGGGGGGSADDDVWGKDGFVELYGHHGRPHRGGKLQSKREPYVPPSRRSAISKEDLRQRLSAKGGRGRGQLGKSGGGKRAALPERCPW